MLASNDFWNRRKDAPVRATEPERPRPVCHALSAAPEDRTSAPINTELRNAVPRGPTWDGSLGD